MEEQKHIAHEKEKNSWSELIKFAVYAALIVIPLRLFIAEPFIVSGASMVPTFQNGQYLIVDELSYRLGDINRGDVVVFHYPNDTKKYFIKRMIGLPGETVTINDSGVKITNTAHPDGFMLNEPYISSAPPHQDPIKVTLQADEYYVLGDNRPFSSDSRVWGTVPKKDLVGRTIIRLFPLNLISIFPGVHKYAEETQN